MAEDCHRIHRLPEDAHCPLVYESTAVPRLYSSIPYIVEYSRRIKAHSCLLIQAAVELVVELIVPVFDNNHKSEAKNERLLSLDIIS